MSREEGSSRRVREKSNGKQKMNVKMEMNRRRVGRSQDIEMNMIKGSRRKKEQE